MVNLANPLTSPRPARATQKVVVVNGNGGMLELLESVLDAGRYDMVFVADSEHAYSQIKHSRPNLVVLCLDLDDVSGFQVLSMLKLDDETSAIPVLTYTNPLDGGEDVSESDGDLEAELPAERPELPMN